MQSLTRSIEIPVLNLAHRLFLSRLHVRLRPQNAGDQKESEIKVEFHTNNHSRRREL